MPELRPFSIYLVTNLITEKWYVGKTGNTVEDRWTDHKSNARCGSNGYLYRSMRKHGEENFYIQTIAVVSTEEEANNLERLWIILLESHKEKFGYNLTLGGDGVRANEETKRKISESSKGRKASPETRAKISAALTGRKLSPENAKRLGDLTRGIPLSEEHKKKLSEVRIGKYGGEKHPMFGKKQTPESVEKTRQANLGRPSWNAGKSWDEETRTNISNGQKRRFQDHPEEKEHLSKISKSLWENPEYRAKMKTAQDARYAREREARRVNPT